MVIKNLYICGCSFLTRRKRLSRTSAGFELASKLGLNPLSYGAGGRGNDRIIAATKHFFSINKEASKDTFALIGWSSSLRKDCLVKQKNDTKLYDELNYWKSIKYTDMSNIAMQQNHSLRKMDVKSTLKLQHYMNILNLQDFFKLRGIKYCMYDALDNQWGGKGRWRQDFESEIDKDRFFGFNTLSHFNFVNGGSEDQVPEEHRNTQLNCDMAKGVVHDAHPNDLGHKLWADKLEVFIKEKGLL
jgi:hypothetical protein